MKSKLLLLVFGILIALAFSEITLRLIDKYKGAKRYVYPPLNTYVFVPDSSIIVGVKGKKQFQTNRQGFRGNYDFTDSTFNVLCIGGSTTECTYLDNNETWYGILNQMPDVGHILRSKGKNVVIASAGLSGQTSFDNYFMLKELLTKNSNINQVILMTGINDLIKFLAKPNLNLSVREVNDSLSKINSISRYWFVPGRINDTTLTAHSILFHSIREHFFSPPKMHEIDRRGVIIRKWRTLYAKRSSLLDTLPPLSKPLMWFNENVNSMIKLCSTYNVDLIIINQASLWDENSHPFYASLLWMGGVGKYQDTESSTYYSPKVLGQGLDSFNLVLSDIARKNAVKYIDIASQLPKDTSVFYDDCHFNCSGARKVANEIASQLKSSKP